MAKDPKLIRRGDTPDGSPTKAPSVYAASGWVTVGNVRVTASEWDLLHRLITTPSLQTATNADLERARVGRQFSSVSTDIDELLSKRLITVHSATREGRTLRPTATALDAMAAL